MSLTEKEKDELLSYTPKRWQTFFLKLKTWEDDKISKWNDHQLLGYFLKRHKDCSGIKYVFDISKTPSKTSELFMMKKLKGAIETTNPTLIKEYIDWVFDKKIIPNKQKVTSVGFLTMPKFINEFLFYKKEAARPRRSVSLPKDYKELANQLNISVETFGDIAFIKMSSDKFKQDITHPNVVFLNNLQAMGLDLNTLDSLED